MTAFLVLLLSVSVPAPPDAYARPADGTVLRLGPGDAFAGVLELDSGAILGLGEVAGTYREVHLPQGFPIYVHEDYAAVDETRANVAITGERVNARVLPTTAGNAPVGQLGHEDDDLVLLGVEGRWVRVLAPERLPLYVHEEDLTTTEVAAGEVLWAQAAEAREARRAWMLAALRANDETWRQESAWRDEVAWLAGQPLATVPDEELRQRLLRLRQIGEVAGWDETRRAVEQAAAAVDELLAQRLATARRVEEVEAQQLEQQGLREREARFLGLGLLFRGRGEAIQRTGTVVEQTVSPDAALYVLQTSRGERFKLTAPINRPRLADLVGRRVELAGRRLELAAVEGPVLVVDRVIWQER